MKFLTIVILRTPSVATPQTNNATNIAEFQHARHIIHVAQPCRHWLTQRQASTASAASPRSSTRDDKDPNSKWQFCGHVDETRLMQLT
ncbi:hypothetical protein BKA62DRAFT_738354 [Auriculariales sp. MPI-PUGE-AT-0066]|nr:hypothetical protein BKA62DRAFT_738354 [Auriculariales sp. MPI-PUGE-AT-0066]